MSMTFTKLFSSITESTVWCEPSDIRIVWIAMLAMADKHGRVWGSIPGLANRARVPVESARQAINSFLSPDKDSRTKDFEGRRIREIDGGWALLNYGKYRAIRDEEERRAYKAMKQRQYRAESGQKSTQKSPLKTKEKRGKTRGQSGHMLNNVDSGGHNAEAEALTTKALNPPSPLNSTPTDANGDTTPPVSQSELNPHGNPEVRLAADLLVLATPEAKLHKWRIGDVTYAHRVAAIEAAKVEAAEYGMSLMESLDGLRSIVESQTGSLPANRLQFQGNVATYFQRRKYRADANELAGGSNGATKGERTLNAAQNALRTLRARHGVGDEGGIGTKGRTLHG